MKFTAIKISAFLVTLIIGSCKPTIVAPQDFYGYDIEARIDSMEITLTEPNTPVANYVHIVQTGDLLFLAGKGPKDKTGKNIVGKLGADLEIEDGYQAARRIGIAQLSVLKSHLGDLNKVKRIVKVLGMVNSTDDYTQHSKVINGFSDLMVEVFGERGKHARAAVGMNSLPGGICAEIEMIVEVE